MFIYHIVLPEVWERSTSQPSFRPDSLEAEGFIHCSFAEQLESVLERYYAGVPRVHVLKIDTDRLISKLVVEPSTNNEKFPHIYGPLNMSAVVETNERRTLHDTDVGASAGS